MKLKKWELALILSFFVTLTYASAAENTVNDIADNMVRLHIIANSNTDDDQALKLKVRDKVLIYVSNLIKDADSKQEVDGIIENSLSSINIVAEDEIRANGYNYNAVTTFEREYFPTKYYDNFKLPSGIYKGLKIKIANASGENWWCVVYPSICIGYASDFDEQFENPDITFDKKIESAGITSDEKDFITGDDYEIKFKTAEIFANVKNSLNKLLKK